MYHISAAQRERARNFDSFVECALEATEQPDVARAIGWMGLSQIRGILETAVLPNVRGSKLTIPAAHRGDDGLAILALDNAHRLARAVWFTNSREDENYIVEYENTDTYSKRYDYRFRGKMSDDEDFDPGERLIEEDEWAKSMTMWDDERIPGRGKKYRRTRPWIIAHPELFTQSRAKIGAIALHEAIHCQDVIEDGPLSLLRRHTASSELRAYHATAVVLNAYGEEDENVAKIESWRLADQDEISPFVPSERLFRRLRVNQLVA